MAAAPPAESSAPGSGQAGSNNPNDSGNISRSRRKHGMLKLYYGIDEESGRSADPCDIDGAHFKSDEYMRKIIKQDSLSKLIDKEADMLKQIRALDSDMQTLVYENYNKFISATDTIRKMKNDFKRMEDEMDKLASNMGAITEFSAAISNTLQDRRQQINKLSGVHALLKKLQFLFELPARLKKCIEMKAYSQAVRYYSKTHEVLQQYQHMPSFHGIYQDCSAIVDQLRDILKQQFHNKQTSPKELAECVDLLVQLKEPPASLCDEFLSHAAEKLDEDLELMAREVRMKSEADSSDGINDRDQVAEALKHVSVDILEFVDKGCNGFLSNLCLVIASYKDLFVNRQAISEENEAELEQVAHSKLGLFVISRMDEYFDHVEARINLEKDTVENTMFVRALDRFHRRLQAINRLLPEAGLADKGTDVVIRAAKLRLRFYTQVLQQHFDGCVTDIRQSLCVPRQPAAVSGGDGGGGGKQEGLSLNKLLATASQSLVEQVKAVLTSLREFIQPDITFAHTPFFRNGFCKGARENLMVSFVNHLCQASKELYDGSEKSSSTLLPALFLILSRLLLDFSSSTLTYLVSIADEIFVTSSGDRSGFTSITQLTALTKDTAQKLLNYYVKVQGLLISQMVRKSVETRDWMNTAEPRNVRAVMKRVVEDVTAIDGQVGQLYEEGIRKARSSDSSKRTFSLVVSRQQQRSQWSYQSSATMDTSLLSNIQKLFAERIEIFSSVEFSKVSVVTGIVKIGLKTLLECVRLRTFGRFGLQQIQVDTHYLQEYLWRFVSDEKLVHALLDEIVASCIHRCTDPVLMEQSVIDVIFERG